MEATVIDEFLVCDDGNFAADRITTYAYDGNDRLLSETTDDDDNNEDRHAVYDWDADDDGTNDSTTQLGKTVYTGLQVDPQNVEKVVTQAYNARGRLAEYAVDEDGDGTIDAEAEYIYDEDGLRVRQTTYDSGVAQETRHFVFDKQNATGYAQAVEELLDDGAGGVSADKAYTVGLDVIAQAVWDAVAGAAKPPAFFVYDGHGSVRQLADKLGEVVKIALDDLGSDVLKADYEAYGDAINFAVASAVTTLLYSGEFTDHASGMQYLRARWYDGASGRFARSDPFDGATGFPQTLHKYLYAHADPITLADPSGELAGAVVVLVLLSAIAVSQLVLWSVALRNASAMTVPPTSFVPVDSALLQTHYHSVRLRGAAMPIDQLFVQMTRLSKRDLGGVTASGDVSGVNQIIRFDLSFWGHDLGQGDFGVSVVRYDEDRRLFAVRTLGGHPLAGWRFWQVSPMANGDILIETFSVEHAFSYADQLKLDLGGMNQMYATWTSMLQDLARASGGSIVQGPDTVLFGAQRTQVLPYLQRIQGP